MLCVTNANAHLSAGLDPVVDLGEQQLVVLHVLEHLDRDHSVRLACKGVGGRKKDTDEDHDHARS